MKMITKPSIRMTWIVLTRNNTPRATNTSMTVVMKIDLLVDLIGCSNPIRPAGPPWARVIRIQSARCGEPLLPPSFPPSLARSALQVISVLTIAFHPRGLPVVWLLIVARFHLMLNCSRVSSKNNHVTLHLRHVPTQLRSSSPSRVASEDSPIRLKNC